MNKRHSVSVTWLFVICLIASCLFSNIDARKFAASARRTSGKTNTGRATNTGRVQKPSADTHKYANADNVKLSYPGTNAAKTPNIQTQQHATPQRATAPEMPKAQDAHQMTGGAAAKPIGWNVQQPGGGTAAGGQIQKQAAPNTNAAPYPQHNVANAPPAYSPHAQAGPPPPYQPHGNANPHLNEAPPAYSPHGAAGFPGN